jgi:D-serine deaminase-like pyridoxal phosphate-dependent protein
VDSEETASLMNETFRQAGKTANCVVKIDTGLHRFGVDPRNVGKFARSLQRYKNLGLLGIATHSGLVYSAQNSEELKRIALQGLECIHVAYEDLRSIDYELKMITVGSTPSFQYDIKDNLATHVHPGNYVYYDAMQVSLGIASLEQCALTVLVTVISKHREHNSVSLNAGVKIFSRDIGGHEIKVVKGYGLVKGYPKAIFKGLSEEVGLLDVKEEPGMKVGEKIQIIPNHSCVVNNNTSYLIGHRGGVVERLIPVDARVGI